LQKRYPFNAYCSNRLYIYIFFLQRIKQQENAENKILSNKRRKLNQEEALKLQVESLQQQLECVTQQCNTERELRLAAEHDRQAILQQLEVKQSQPSTSSSTLDKEALKELQRLQQQLELERQQSLEKIANLEKQLQKEIDEKTAQAEQSQKELMALREQVDNLQYGVRMNRALLKINRFVSPLHPLRLLNNCPKLFVVA